MSITGTIFDLKKYAIHDGPGIRTTVFLKGCPLNCWWCHNPEGRCPTPVPAPAGSRGRQFRFSHTAEDNSIGREVTVAAVVDEVLKDAIFYDQSGGGVTFSGGEPMMQPEFLLTLLKESRRRGIHTAVDTSGYAPAEDFEMIYREVELFLYDIKLMDDSEHRKFVGVSNQLILDNLSRLASKNKEIIVRIPMVPGITDTTANLSAIAAYLEMFSKIRRISLLPYNKLGEDKIERLQLAGDRHHWSPQSAGELKEKGRLLQSYGYEVKIGG